MSAFLGSGLAMIVFGGLLILIFFLAIGGLIASLDKSGKTTSVTENSVLELNFDAPIIDRGNDKNMNFDFSTFAPDASIGLDQLLANIEKAETDEHIKGIYLNLSSVQASPSTCHDIRRALVEFKESGKWIVAYGEEISQSGYYVASAANEIYLYPEGMMEWKGLYTELAFFSQMLEKLDVKIQIVRGPDNKYKSAVEPFMYDKMSDANREQIETFLQTIWNGMVDEVAQSRGVSAADLNMLADSLSAFFPQQALNYKLVDGLKYGDEVLEILKSKAGTEAEKDLELVSFAKYKNAKAKKAEATEEEPETADNSEEEKEKDTSIIGGDKIAVVYAIGAIESGEGDDATIGSDRIAKALRDAREDENVKAVVLRVNSPGGSALASDVIWRETQLIKQSGKPFVVSMGDLAASGGYYIACGADKIYANASTLTGSIGVFGMVPVTGEFFQNKLGITFDDAKTNAHSDLMTTTEPMDEYEAGVVQNWVIDIYDQFITIVADGRGMTKTEVDSIAQGRVWAGADAKNIGLVDEIGNLDDAIDEAARLAGITDYKLKNLPKMLDPFEELVKELGGETSASTLLAKSTGKEYQWIKYIQQMEDMVEAKGVQARLPFFIEFK